MNTFGTSDDQLDRTDNRLISSERVTGTNVYNAAGDKLGSIETVMIDKLSGQVRFAVMSFGGFLGLGEKYHQLPWDGLTYDEDKGGYTVNLTREALEGAPSYGRDEIDNFDYDSEGDEIDRYYGGIDGFYSPEQQSRRNARNRDNGTGMAAGSASSGMSSGMGRSGDINEADYGSDPTARSRS